jgi:hypothetical protein
MRKSFSANVIEFFTISPPRVLFGWKSNFKYELNEKFKRMAAQNFHTSYEEVPVWPQVSLGHTILWTLHKCLKLNNFCECDCLPADKVVRYKTSLMCSRSANELFLINPD